MMHAIWRREYRALSTTRARRSRKKRGKRRILGLLLSGRKINANWWLISPWAVVTIVSRKRPEVP